jgi:aryl-alcohol dehydrogenase-like predicted oxidoreductase
MEGTIMSGIKVSKIGIGCWAFGGGDYWGEQNQKDVDGIVSAALELGLTTFDTARMYNDGASEASLGLALKGKRDKAVIISKVNPAMAYKKTLIAECEASLKNLQTDYLDMYMMHWPINKLGIRHFTKDPAVIANPPTNEEAFGTLAELQKQGKIKSIGISNYGIKQMTEAVEVCKGLGVRIEANELPYNIVSRAIEAEIVPFCKQQDIKIITSMAMQQGVLTGLYKNAQEVPPHQAHSRHFSMETGGGTSRHGEAGAEKEVFETVELLRELAPGFGLSVAQLSLAWILANPDIDCALVGSRNVSELNDNFKAMQIKLPAEAKKKIDDSSKKVWDKLGNSPDYYENSKESRIF